MDPTPQPPKRQDKTLLALNAAIQALDPAEKATPFTPAKTVFGSVNVLLGIIKDTTANKTDCIKLGLDCAEVCKAIERGVNDRQARPSVLKAIEQLEKAMAEIKRDIIVLNGRSTIANVVYSKSNKEKIAAWRAELDRILQVFKTELAINTNVTVTDIQCDIANTKAIVSDTHRMVKRSERTDGRNASSRPSTSGELPPPPPSACFGREVLIKKIVCLAESLTSIALTGTGGIGKTCISLKVLNHDRIKKRFGDNRRFIPCDQLSASCFNFLARLSQVVGAGVKKPKDLIPLRPFLSSKEMLIVLDNAESILDPQGSPDKREIYGLVEELGRFPNISLVITSRITTIPPSCKTLTIPTLPSRAARDAFYHIYQEGRRSGSVDRILKQLDFHPLSVTLLATVAHQNRWDNDRLAGEWRQHRTSMLRTEHQTSLAATVELSLASPLFRALGSDARELLGVIAFYPQGVNENNLHRLFPTIPNVTQVFDTFRILSLTHRSNGFITMLAPLRDHLRPTHPNFSPFLRMTKDHYFTQMSVKLDPVLPGFKDAQWIVGEDLNVEHLFDLLMSVNPDSIDIWNACNKFLAHLYWFKPRHTILRPKIEALSDDHPSKPDCLTELAILFETIGDFSEQYRLLIRALELAKERGIDQKVAFILKILSRACWMQNFREEAIHRLTEALEVYERLEDKMGLWWCLDQLAQWFREQGELDEAEEAAVRSKTFLPKEGQEFKVCQSHHTLGDIYRSKGQRERAVYHLKAVLEIASSFDWHHYLFWAHLSLADPFLVEGEFDNAYAHIEQAKLHAFDNSYKLGRVAYMQASILYRQCKLEEARSEVSRALEIYQKCGASKDIEDCRDLLQNIQRATERGSPSAARTGDRHGRKQTSGRAPRF